MTDYSENALIEQPSIAVQLTEEELAAFDLLTKLDMNL